MSCANRALSPHRKARAAPEPPRASALITCKTSGVDPVPAQMWQGVSPVPAQMWPARPERGMPRICKRSTLPAALRRARPESAVGDRRRNVLHCVATCLCAVGDSGATASGHAPERVLIAGMVAAPVCRNRAGSTLVWCPKTSWSPADGARRSHCIATDGLAARALQQHLDKAVFPVRV
jgi:hypothetical protein